jgi:hypothetical protein
MSGLRPTIKIECLGSRLQAQLPTQRVSGFAQDHARVTVVSQLLAVSPWR